MLKPFKLRDSEIGWLVTDAGADGT